MTISGVSSASSPLPPVNHQSSQSHDKSSSGGQGRLGFYKIAQLALAAGVSSAVITSGHAAPTPTTTPITDLSTRNTSTADGVDIQHLHRDKRQVIGNGCLYDLKHMVTGETQTCVQNIDNQMAKIRAEGGCKWNEAWTQECKQKRTQMMQDLTTAQKALVTCGCAEQAKEQAAAAAKMPTLPPPPQCKTVQLYSADHCNDPDQDVFTINSANATKSADWSVSSYKGKNHERKKGVAGGTVQEVGPCTSKIFTISDCHTQDISMHNKDGGSVKKSNAVGLKFGEGKTYILTTRGGEMVFTEVKHYDMT